MGMVAVVAGVVGVPVVVGVAGTDMIIIRGIIILCKDKSHFNSFVVKNLCLDSRIYLQEFFVQHIH